jgi:hypothetical protein
MIPPAQFDPATLAIWTTTVALGGEEPEIADAVMGMAARGEDPVPIINDLPKGHALRSRLVWLVSSVWHEKRHYFDTCFTNYGARRFRDLFTLAANVAPLLVDAKDRNEAVWFPVEVYGFPPRLRKAFGIPDPPENISRMAALARSMKSLMSQLDAAPGAGNRVIELGGAAQLEGLAQISQTHAVEYYFGLDDLHDISKEFIHKLPREGPYRAIESVAGALGCSKTVRDAVYVNTTLAAALFMSALCGRYLGAGPEPDRELIAPWPRLARMIEELGPTPGHFDMTDEQAAEMVDKVARKLWGRTAFEEIAADVDLMEQRLDLSKAPWLAEEGLYDAYMDFVALRRRLLSAARTNGPASLLPRAFPVTWVNRLRPWHVRATPAGDSQPNSSDIVFGVSLNLPAQLQSDLPSEVSWGRLFGAPREAAEEFAPRQREAWLQMLQRHGPYALLMLNGRRHRRMVPPELERPVKEIETLGIPVRFHPRFEWPETRDQETRAHEAVTLAEFSGRKTFVCDVTGQTIEPSMAVVLTPWEFRRSKLFDQVREGGIMNQIMLVTNWSDWVVRRDLLE